jgi:hypothetical protein
MLSGEEWEWVGNGRRRALTFCRKYFLSIHLFILILIISWTTDGKAHFQVGFSVHRRSRLSIQENTPVMVCFLFGTLPTHAEHANVPDSVRRQNCMFLLLFCSFILILTVCFPHNDDEGPSPSSSASSQHHDDEGLSPSSSVCFPHNDDEGLSPSSSASSQHHDDEGLSPSSSVCFPHNDDEGPSPSSASSQCHNDKGTTPCHPLLLNTTMTRGCHPRRLSSVHTLCVGRWAHM